MTNRPPRPPRRGMSTLALVFSALVTFLVVVGAVTALVISSGDGQSFEVEPSDLVTPSVSGAETEAPR